MSELMGKRFCGGEGQVPEGRRGLGFSWADVVSRAAAPAKLRQERHVYSTLPAKDSSPGLWPVVSSQTCNPEGCQKVAGGRGAAQTRQAEMKPPRSNPKGVVAGRQRWRPVFRPPGRDPVGVDGPCRAITRGWRHANPWPARACWPRQLCRYWQVVKVRVQRLVAAGRSRNACPT